MLAKAAEAVESGWTTSYTVSSQGTTVVPVVAEELTTSPEPVSGQAASAESQIADAAPAVPKVTEHEPVGVPPPVCSLLITDIRKC